MMRMKKLKVRKSLRTLSFLFYIRSNGFYTNFLVYVENKGERVVVHADFPILL